MKLIKQGQDTFTWKNVVIPDRNLTLTTALIMKNNMPLTYEAIFGGENGSQLTFNLGFGAIVSTVFAWRIKFNCNL